MRITELIMNDNNSQNRGECRACGANNWGTYTSSSTGKISHYCRACRRTRATLYNQRRTLARSKPGGKHTRRQWEEKLSTYSSCPGCHRKWQDIPPRPDSRYKSVITKDHIVPLTLGGSDAIDNLQPLCYRCNFAKCNGRGNFQNVSTD